MEWELLGTELPLTIASDLRYHRPTNKLLVASFGRSLYTYQFDDPVSSTEEITSSHNILKVYPNPLNNSQANIEFDLENAGVGKIQLLNIQGQVLKTITQRKFSAGKQNVKWNPSDLTKGTYFVRLEMEDKNFAQKIIKQ